MLTTSSVISKFISSQMTANTKLVKLEKKKKKRKEQTNTYKKKQTQYTHTTTLNQKVP